MLGSSVRVCHVLFVMAVAVTVSTMPCAAEVRGHVTYQPPLIPVEVTLDSDGNLDISASGTWVTPLGTFSLGVSYGTETYSVLTLLVDGTEYKYAIGGKGFDVRLSGLKLQRITEDGKGNVTVVATKDVRLLDSRSRTSSVLRTTHDPRTCPKCIQEAQAAGMAAVKRSGGHDPNQCAKCREIYNGAYNTFMVGRGAPKAHDPRTCSVCIQEAHTAGMAAIAGFKGHNPNTCAQCRAIYQRVYNSTMTAKVTGESNTAVLATTVTNPPRTVPLTGPVTMSWTFTDDCRDSRGNRIRFFDKKKKLVWPTVGQTYLLGRGQTQTFNLSVERGQDICYGAEIDQPGTTTYWGMGIDGARGCSECCYYGAATEVKIRLTCS